MGSCYSFGHFFSNSSLNSSIVSLICLVDPQSCLFFILFGILFHLYYEFSGGVQTDDKTAWQARVNRHLSSILCGVYTVLFIGV